MSIGAKYFLGYGFTKHSIKGRVEATRFCILESGLVSFFL